MDWMDRLERRVEPLSVPRLGRWLVAGQVLLYIALAAGWVEPADLVLRADRVLAGEPHRLLTFLFAPPAVHPVFLFFALYLFWLMAEGLEARWGAFRFNLFLLVGYAATLGAVFLYPAVPATNVFLAGSVFVAFAHLYPDFELNLFFVIPVRIKWLALAAWIGYGLSFLAGPAGVRAQTLASCLAFFLFFGRDLARAVRVRAVHASPASPARTPFHRCDVCGRTDLSDPNLDFIYVPGPSATRCLCRDHADS